MGSGLVLPQRVFGPVLHAGALFCSPGMSPPQCYTLITPSEPLLWRVLRMHWALQILD